MSISGCRPPGWAIAAVMVAAACGPGKPRDAEQPSGTTAPPDAAPVAVAVPDAAPPQPDLAALEKAVNQTKVGRHLCWEIAAVDGYELSGTLKLHVAFDGDKAKVGLVSDTTGDSVLTRCMVDLYTSYPWPSTVRNVPFDLPFQFGAPRGQYTVGYDRVQAAARYGAKVGSDKLAGGNLSAWVLLDRASTGNEAASMSALELRGGLDVPLHRHRTAELLYLASGRGVIYGIGGAKRGRKVKPGDAIYIPAGAPHGFLHHGTEPAKLLQLYTPAGAEQRFKGGGSAGTTPVTAAEVKKVMRSRKLRRKVRRPVVVSLDKVKPLVIAGGKGKVHILHEPARTRDDRAYMGVIELAAGTLVPAHKHPGSTELLFVRSGKGVMTVNGTRYPVGPGTAIQIPPNIEHAFVAGEAVTALQFYTPAGPEQRFKKAKAKAKK